MVGSSDIITRNDKMEKVLNNIWLTAGAFFIGRVGLLGLNSLAPGYFIAVCLLKRGVISGYIMLMIGMATILPVVDVIRYGMIMLGIGLLSNVRSIDGTRGKSNIVFLVSGVIAVVINLCVHFFYPDEITILESVLEAVIIVCSGVLYGVALEIITKDYMRVSFENEAAISVVILAATVLFGMPEELGDIVIAETFAIFGVLLSVYKFGFSVGVIWTVVAATIMTGVTGNSGYMTVWLLVATATYAITNLINGGRIIFTLCFGIIYYLCGIIYYDFLLLEDSLKAFMGALLVFLFMPARYMINVDYKVKNGELVHNSPEWGKLIINRVNALAMAFKRIDYTLASDASSGIGFNDVGNIIEDFTNQLEHTIPVRKTIEANIIEELAILGIEVKSLSVVRNNEGRCEVYLNARVKRGRLITADKVRAIIEREMGFPLELKEESRNIVSHSFDIIAMREKPKFLCYTAVRRLSKYEDEVSGDNFYIGDIEDGQKLIIIADGMGNGKNASKDSNALIDSLEELLYAGFDKETSIRIVNSYLSNKNKGERFATLDMLILDLHSGCGRLYKQGAATTFIKRGEWMEMVKSTSLPMGVIEGAVCEKCVKKFYNDDIVVMVSDGVLESIIFENKEDYIRDILLNTESDVPDEIANEVVEHIKSLSGNRLKDDATIIVCKIKEKH